VSQGRRGRALRVDGTFASWYAPGSTVTGSVWDALAAPILLVPPDQRRSILVLGLGGGSAARIARALAPRARIVGVERDRQVVRAARRWFDLDDLAVQVVVDDAREYLARTRARHDVVLEDIFVGTGRNLHKPEWLPSPGLDLAARRLRPGGVLASNAIDEAARVTHTLQSLFPATLRIDVRGYDNRIVVGSGRVRSGSWLRRAVRRDPVLASSAPVLSFRGPLR
jgi:spermidine synthase